MTTKNNPRKAQTPRLVIKHDHIRHAGPWDLPLADLARLERQVVEEEGQALVARWSFGRELLRHQVEYKGRKVIAPDLMKLTMKKIGLGRTEVLDRMRFATKYPTKAVMSVAVGHYPSWRQMRRDGIVDTKKKPATKTPPQRRGLQQLRAELSAALAAQATLTRADIKELEQILALTTKLLAQIDANDAKKAAS